MRPGLLPSLLTWALPLLLSAQPLPGAEPGAQTCATVSFQRPGTTHWVAHNLDETIQVPGLVVVNPRGVVKESLSYADMMTFSGRSKDARRLTWVSKYRSLVVTTCGREFIDGGMNDQGFYVGEMTLLGSKYPEDPALVKVYHHAWMQYLLDNFRTVGEALESLKKVVPDGHCQWHFFLADEAGSSAVVEFDEGKTLVYTGASLPQKVSTNYTYPSCLKKLASFQGFGGSRILDFTYRPEAKEDFRFFWASDMLRQLGEDPGTHLPGDLFKVLEQLWCGGNRWSLVFDLGTRRIYWNTHLSRKQRSLELGRVQDGADGRPLAVDIHRDAEGDMVPLLAPLTDELNRQAIETFWKGVDMGIAGAIFWRPRIIKAMDRYGRDLRPPR